MLDHQNKSARQRIIKAEKWNWESERKRWRVLHDAYMKQRRWIAIQTYSNVVCFLGEGLVCACLYCGRCTTISVSSLRVRLWQAKLSKRRLHLSEFVKWSQDYLRRRRQCHLANTFSLRIGSVPAQTLPKQIMHKYSIWLVINVGDWTPLSLSGDTLTANGACHANICIQANSIGNGPKLNYKIELQ